MQGNASSGEATKQLTPKQESLIAILCSGVHIAAAAKSLGIAESTAYKWLKLPAFKRAYRSAQHDLFRDSLQALHGKIDKAITTLDRNMDSEDTPASTQVRAAQVLLDLSLAVDKMSELEALQEKVAELEQAMKQQPGRV